jgi:hypothetical protein
MAEEITQTAASETQSVATVAPEENTTVSQDPQVSNQEQVNETNSVENGNGEQVEENQTTESTTEQPTVEQLQAKIKEYEIRDEEDRKLRETLGIQDVDQQTFNLMNMDQQIINVGKQHYLRLCNEYGVDADPSKIDASVKALKESDPAKGYEFERRFEQLGNEVVGRRQAVQQQNAYYEVSKFQNDFNPILNASPALTNVMSQYVQSYGNTPGMYNQLHNVMDIILPVYQEAYNAGKQFALQDKAKNDTSGVQGGIAAANTSTYTGDGQTFTRDQIRHMSTDEFSKYEKAIMQQMREGKIQ